MKKKLQVKVFKTDRSLTGKDKTNRRKRWEVLPDDFQHATLEQCWSAERQLTADLVGFDGFPKNGWAIVNTRVFGPPNRHPVAR